MTDKGPDNHRDLCIFLLGAAYGLDRQTAAEKAKTLEERDVHREVKELWRAVINKSATAAVTWFDNHGAPGIGSDRDIADAIDAALRAVRKTGKDLRCAQWRETIALARTHAEMQEVCRKFLVDEA